MTTEERKPKFALVTQVPDEDDAEEGEGEEEKIEDVDSPLSLRPPTQAKITEGEEEEDENDDLSLPKEPTTTIGNNTNNQQASDSKNAEKKYENYVNTIAQTKDHQTRTPSPNT